MAFGRPDGRIMNRNADKIQRGTYTLTVKGKKQDISFLFKQRRRTHL